VGVEARLWKVKQKRTKGNTRKKGRGGWANRHWDKKTRIQDAQGENGRDEYIFWRARGSLGRMRKRVIRCHGQKGGARRGRGADLFGKGLNAGGKD